MTYEDKRDEYTRVLWDYADGMRFKEHEQRARVVVVRAIVQIACHEEAIRSVKQAIEVRGVGEALMSVLETRARSRIITERGRYASAAVAMLSVLYDEEGLVSMGALIRLAEAKLESGRKFLRLERIISSPGACTAWAQMTPLESTGWVRKRQRKAMPGNCGYELTETGRKVAARLVIDRLGTGELEEIEAVRSWESQNVPFYLVVDDREGGGEAKSLGNLTRRFRLEEIPFRTARLECGDYLFVRAADKVCFDAIVERKTAVDLADSIRDGRWKRQYTQMCEALDGQYTKNKSFDMHGIHRIIYLIEGNPQKHVHKACGCGCQGVGRCGNPTVPELRRAIDEKASLPRVTIIETLEERETARWIKSTLADIANRYALPKATPTKKRKNALEIQNDDDDENNYRAQHQDSQQDMIKPRALLETPSKKKSSAANSTNSASLAIAARAWSRRDRSQLAAQTLSILKELCIATGENTSGTKAALVTRLLEPPEPALLAKRRRQAEYFPRDRTAGHAFMCALEIAHRQGLRGLTKDDLMARAEKLAVCPKSIYTKCGPFGYDGWAVARDLVSRGTVPLVRRVNPGALYALTEHASIDAKANIIVNSGLDVAIALHFKAHLRDGGYCSCGSPPPPSEATRQISLEDILKDLPSHASRRIDIFTVATAVPPTPPTKNKAKESKRGDDTNINFFEPKKVTKSRKPSSPASLDHDSDSSDDILDLTSDADAPESSSPHRRKRNSTRSCIDLTLDDSDSD